MKKCVIGGFIDTNLREEEKTAISEKKTAFSSFKHGLAKLESTTCHVPSSLLEKSRR